MMARQIWTGHGSWMKGRRRDKDGGSCRIQTATNDFINLQATVSCMTNVGCVFIDHFLASCSRSSLVMATVR